MNAIEKLEKIKNSLIPTKATLNFMIDEVIAELQSLENRSCKGCKFNSSKTKTDELILCDRARGYVNQRNIIYCGRWESK